MWPQPYLTSHTKLSPLSPYIWLRGLVENLMSIVPVEWAVPGGLVEWHAHGSPKPANAITGAAKGMTFQLDKKKMKAR